MPADPVMRERTRLFLYNFEKELFAHVSVLENRISPDTKVQDQARQGIRDRLSQLAPILLNNKYMLGDAFSMLDVAVAPLLWRLDHYGLALPKNAEPLHKYDERNFSHTAHTTGPTPPE